jgi:hypothetical protein
MSVFVQLSAGHNMLEIFFEHFQQFAIVSLLFFQQFHLVLVKNHFMVRVNCQHVFLVNLQLFIYLRLNVLQDLQNSFVFMDELIVGGVFIRHGSFKLFSEGLNFADVGHFRSGEIHSRFGHFN